MITVWPEVTLGDVCEMKYGRALPKADRSGCGFGVYGSNGEVGRHDHAVTSGPTIIVGRKGSFGEVNFSEAPCWPIDTTYYVDGTGTAADLRWLYYRLRALRLTDLNTAAAVPGLNRDDAYRQKLLLPPLEEQRRIATVLNAAEALRDGRKKSLATLDILIDATFTESFGDPRAFDRLSLGEVSGVQSGLQVTHTRQSNPIEVPYLRVANVYRGYLDLDEIKQLRVTETELDRTRLQSGDLLVVEGHGNKSEIGRVAIWAGQVEGCVHQNHLIRVRCDTSRLLPRFAEAYLNSLVGRRSLLAAANTTSGLNTISTRDVRDATMMLPSVDRQRQFVSIAESVDQRRDELLRSAGLIDRLFASLQQRAFRGEL